MKQYRTYLGGLLLFNKEKRIQFLLKGIKILGKLLLAVLVITIILLTIIAIYLIIGDLLYDGEFDESIIMHPSEGNFVSAIY